METDLDVDPAPGELRFRLRGAELTKLTPNTRGSVNGRSPCGGNRGGTVKSWMSEPRVHHIKGVPEDGQVDF